MNLVAMIQNKYYSLFMLLIIFFYAFFSIKFHHEGNIFLGLIILGSLPVFVVYKNKILKDPIFLIFMLVLLIQILSWINSLIYVPEFANSLPKLDRLGKLFVFFFIAYWLQGKIQNIILLWLFFIFGFLFTIVLNVDVTTLFQLGLDQPRVDLSIKNSQFDSMLAGTSLLMSSFLFYMTFKSSNQKSIKILQLIGISILILIFSYLVLVTQSRQVLLGLITVAIIGPIAYAIINRGINIKTMFVGLLVFASISFLFTTSQIVPTRFLKEQKIINSILKNDKSIKMTSIGIRVNSWFDAKDWIIKHPLLGLDSEAIPQVIQQSNRFDDDLKKKYGHLHNFFIETLVAYGFLGFLLIIAMYYFIIKSIWNSSLSSTQKKYYVLVSICFVTYWIIINNFETFNSRSLGVFTHNIIFASIYTFHMKYYYSNKEESLN